MPAFRKIYTSDPGFATLLSVAQTAIIDRAPPRLVLGQPSGVACVVGEFEAGPLEAPTEVTTPSERERIYGGLGFTVGGLLSEGPVAQKSGGNEPWNGNGFMACVNKPWGRLVIQRVDNSAGQVELTRLACTTGVAGPYSAANGDQATFLLNGVTTATATVTHAKASISGTGVVYPLPAGTLTNLTILLAWDDIPEEDAQTVTFSETDINVADVIAKANAQLATLPANPIAFDDGGQLGLQSVRSGSGARLQIVGGTALTDLGLPTAVTQDEWTIQVTADTAITTELRVSKTVSGLPADFDTTAFLGPVGSLTLKRDKLLTDTVTDPPQLSELNVPGFTFSGTGAGGVPSVDTIRALGAPNQILTGLTALQGGAELTILNTVPGVALEVFGTGNVFDSEQITTQEAVDIVDAVANLGAAVNADGTPRFCNELTPATGSIVGDSGDFLTALGVSTTDVVDANNGPDVTIPAGTRVEDQTTGTVWVTLVDVQTGSGGGPFECLVRPFTDTDTALPSAIGDVTILLSELDGGFAVTNAATITRLSAAQLDARYIRAIDRTRGRGRPTADVNNIVSARSSAAIRDRIAVNTREATAIGLAGGRRGFTSPRLGAATTRDVALDWAESIRDERVQAPWPGVRTAVEEVRNRGVTGGVGFADDGVVNLRSDTWVAAIRTIIRPEQSAAEDQGNTNFGKWQVAGLEEAYDPEVPGSTELEAEDYVLLKAGGVAGVDRDRNAGPGSSTT